MKKSIAYIGLVALGASIAGCIWFAREYAAAKDEIQRQKAEIVRLQGETERLDRELWRIPRGLDFKKPFAVEPGSLIDEASLAANFMDTEGGYLGFKPADIVGEKDSKRVAEISGFMDKTWATKPEAEKAAAALRTWMAYWMAGSDLGWKVEVEQPESSSEWRVRFRVEHKELAEKIRQRNK